MRHQAWDMVLNLVPGLMPVKIEIKEKAKNILTFRLEYFNLYG
jgi:hypothetical protein